MENEITFKIESFSKKYTLGSGKHVVAIQDISFSAFKGEFISIIGPSGCGKSTLIKMIAGLIAPTSGKIIENDDADVAPYGNRGVIFQQYSLFPWLNVQANIGFGLQTIGTSESEIKDIVSHYVDSMGLTGFEKAYPKELSGGMQQRVALARTLATDPRVLLMDEPFSALDVQTRRAMQNLLLQMLHRKPRTVILVTHDIDEAIFLSHTVYILTPGPGRILEKVNIELSRGRDASTEFSAEYLQLKQYIRHSLKVISTSQVDKT